MSDGAGESPGKEGGPRREITVRLDWCKGCHYCVEFCPSGVFEADGHRVRVVGADRCSGCLLCTWICPDFAIEVR